MYQKTNAKFVIKITSILILTLLFSCSFFFDTAGPPQAYAADNIFTDNVGIGTTGPSQKLHVEGQCVTGDTLLPVIRAQKGGTNPGNMEILGSFKLNHFPNNLPNPDLSETREVTNRQTREVNSAEIEFIPIKKVRAGDYAMSLNEETGVIEPHRINGLLDMGVKPVFRLTTASGRTIRTTGNHPYLVKNFLRAEKSAAEKAGFELEGNIMAGDSGIESAKWLRVAGLSEGDEIAVAKEELFTGQNKIAHQGDHTSLYDTKKRHYYHEISNEGINEGRRHSFENFSQIPRHNNLTFKEGKEYSNLAGPEDEHPADKSCFSLRNLDFQTGFGFHQLLTDISSYFCKPFLKFPLCDFESFVFGAQFHLVKHLNQSFSALVGEFLSKNLWYSNYTHYSSFLVAQKIYHSVKDLSSLFAEKEFSETRFVWQDSRRDNSVTHLAMVDVSDKDSVRFPENKFNAVIADAQPKFLELSTLQLNHLSMLEGVIELADFFNFSDDARLFFNRKAGQFLFSGRVKEIIEHRDGYLDAFSLFLSRLSTSLAGIHEPVRSAVFTRASVSLMDSCEDNSMKSTTSSKSSLERTLDGASTPRRFLSSIIVKCRDLFIQNKYNTFLNNLSRKNWESYFGVAYASIPKYTDEVSAQWLKKIDKANKKSQTLKLFKGLLKKQRS